MSRQGSLIGARLKNSKPDSLKEMDIQMGALRNRVNILEDHMALVKINLSVMQQFLDMLTESAISNFYQEEGTSQ